MHSSLTQAEPLSEQIVLQFGKNCPHNTTIRSLRESDVVCYDVSSDPQAMITRVTKIVDEGMPAEVGTIQRHTFSSDVIILGSVSTRMDKWLKTSWLNTLYVTSPHFE